jgi:hypothetical protein
MLPACCSFKYETMYGWHIYSGNFTPQSQSGSVVEIETFYNITGRPGILELQSVFFTKMNATGANGKPLRGQMLKPTATADWEALLPILLPLIERKVIVGFMLGDEIVRVLLARASKLQL